MAFTGSEQHEISFEVGGALTKKYRDQMAPGQRKGGFFGSEAIQALLNQDHCVGIRYYYGLDKNGKQELVLVGTDANENDLVGEGNLCMDVSIPCPDRCGENNILNTGT